MFLDALASLLSTGNCPTVTFSENIISSLVDWMTGIEMEMVGNGWKWLEMVGYGWKWLKMVRSTTDLLLTYC